MLCQTCNKLQILPTNKFCIKCKAVVKQNIAILCDTCSMTSKSCAACLRKINKASDGPIYRSPSGGCKSCGRK